MSVHMHFSITADNAKEATELFKMTLGRRHKTVFNQDFSRVNKDGKTDLISVGDDGVPRRYDPSGDKDILS